MFQNDGTRNGENFNLHRSSFNAMTNNTVGKQHQADIEQVNIDWKRQHEEMVSSSSFLSKHSSKFDVD